MDPLITKSVRRLKLAVVFALSFGVTWALLRQSLSWWLLIPLVALSGWAVQPAQVWHWRRFRHGR